MIESVIICALFVYGVSCVINGYADFFNIDLYLFYNYLPAKVMRPTEQERPKWQKFILKPTIYCNVCMSSFWGSIFYLCAYWGDIYLFDWALHLIVSAGIITIINKLPE